MSIERYFQRAHDEARRLLREMPWLRKPSAFQRARWLVATDMGTHVQNGECMSDAGVPPAVVGGHVVGAVWLGPTWLRRVLDRAMFEPGAMLLRSGGVTLGPGEGAEARRLLELVAWDRTPQARWPEVFDTLRMAAAWRAAGHENWLTTTRALLEEDGYLVDGAGRKAA